MSTTVSYKGQNIATVSNNTKTLETEGKYLEADIILTDQSQSTPIIDDLTVTPSETQQTYNSSSLDGYKPVVVNAIPSTYVGSGIDRRDSTDLTASGSTVSVPSGFYENNASKAVASGTAGTPSATKGTVSNHSVSVTPSVTNTTGYINGGTKTGTAVTVSASELVSGTKSITQNGTDIDVTNYASVDVAVPSSQPNLQTKSATYTPSTSQQTDTITADSGYDGLDEVDITVNAMPSGSATPPTTISGSQATVTAGTNTISLQKTLSVTPRVTPGYVASGTADNVLVYLNANVPTKEATTYTPSRSTQTIAADTYLKGTQTINPIPSEYIIPSGTKSITSNGTGIDVTNYASVDVAIPFATIRTGTTTPSSSLGVNGDIYIKTG